MHIGIASFVSVSTSLVCRALPLGFWNSSSHNGPLREQPLFRDAFRDHAKGGDKDFSMTTAFQAGVIIPHGTGQKSRPVVDENDFGTKAAFLCVVQDFI